MARVERTVDEVLTRGVAQVLPSQKGFADLMKKKKINLYNGIDPTGGELHIGHSLVLRKLQQFQELGHEVIMLVGTFTAQIGDPSDRESPRQPLTPARIKENMATYKKQASKILDFSKVGFLFNGDWLSKLTFEDVVKLASKFTVQQMIERDMFQRRLKKNKPIWLHEFMYPLMQGYDSVHMNVDLEVGATDQTFNMLAGRTLQKIYNKREKYVLTTPLLVGLDGRKMSKTYKNTVNLTDPPNEMYGKLMSLKDELIMDYFELCTDVAEAELKGLAKDVKKDPMGAKKKLAYEITRMYYSKKAVDEAGKEFERVVQEGGAPTKIQTVSAKALIKSPTVLDIVIKTGLAESKSDARRIIKQGGVEIGERRVKDPDEKLKLKIGDVIKVGKRGFRKLGK
jgi:tyrosyl-tRNA synthetase